MISSMLLYKTKRGKTYAVYKTRQNENVEARG